MLEGQEGEKDFLAAWAAAWCMSGVGVRTADGVLTQALGCLGDLAASAGENLLPALRRTRNPAL